MTEAKLISALNEENLSHFSKTYVPSRLLLGPGPSNAHPEFRQINRDHPTVYKTKSKAGEPYPKPKYLKKGGKYGHTFKTGFPSAKILTPSSRAIPGLPSSTCFIAL